MNKEYIQVGEMYVVNTDNGLKKKERLNNTTEILETENNIEEMKNIKKDIENKEFFNFKTIFDSFISKDFAKTGLIIAPICILISIGMVMSNSLILSLLLAPTAISCGFSILIIASKISTSKANKFDNIMHEKANDYLEKELEKEKQKLNELNKESVVLPKYDLGILDETVKIDRTKLIEDLKLKLELIGTYELNKKKYIKYYENNSLYEKLSNEGYSKNEILLIEELIKNDMVEKTNEKILKLEKK